MSRATSSLQVTGISYIKASPYISKSQMMQMFNISQSTASRRISDLDRYVQNAMYYNECQLCGAYLDPGEHCDCEEERQRQTQRIMSMIRENKESHQMELVLN